MIAEVKQMGEQLIIEQLNHEFSEIVARVSKSIVSISGRRTAASGIAWSTDLIIAPAHSLHRGSQYEVITSEGETLTATLAGREPSLDIAILKTKPSPPEVEKSLNEPLKSGELAISLGRARGGRVLSALTMLSISETTYRNWRGGTFDRFIRTDIFPFPGFSGSALVLANGKVAGMNTAAFSRHFGMTVPASVIDRLVQKFSTHGSIGRPYLGLMMQPVRLPEKLSAQSGTEWGWLVTGTEKGSPAETAGLLLGDVVVRLNEKNVNSMETLSEWLSEFKIGSTLNVGLLRGGQSVAVSLNVGERAG